MIESPNLNSYWGHLIVEELVRNGCTYFCVSPGSRSTPLTVAVARHPQAQSAIFYDERGAAFHALGYARATGKPAVLICSSGTAVANYLPAVIEAEMDRVPIIILSADRSPELRQTMANQTIDQVGIFGHHVRWFFDFPTPSAEIAPNMVLTTVDQAVYRAQQSPAGAVHLNCMFREPLAPIEQPFSAEANALFQQWQQSDQPYTRYLATHLQSSEQTLAELHTLIGRTERGLLLVGQLQNEAEREAVRRLADWLRWPIFADVTSGLRFGWDSEWLISYFDQALLATSENDSAETILHVGGQFVSKRLLEFCQKYPARHYILHKSDPSRHDPFHAVTWRIDADLAATVNWLISHSAPSQSPNWIAHWQQKNQIIAQLLQKELDQSGQPLSEMGIGRIITQSADSDHALFMGNSMPIRDIDMYGDSNRPALQIATNRGASGIDGNIATATGFAIGTARPTTAIIGDLTFLHDLSSLSILRHLTRPFILIVVNNHGGGIFSFLPVAQFPDVFEQFFGTPHPFSFAAMAQAFGMAYHRPKDSAELRSIYRLAQTTSRATLIEIETNRDENVSAHRALQAKIKELLQTGVVK